MKTYALVLTSSPAAPALTAEIVDRALAALSGSTRGETLWLSEHEAWQVQISVSEPPDADQFRATVAEALANLPADVNVVPDDASRRKKLLVADMESTIIEQECLDELADHIGLRDRISEITARAMRGEIAFEEALKERVRLLKGLKVDVLGNLYNRLTFMPGARELVATMRANGAYCALVSGGFTFFTERIAARLGFNLHRANTLEITNGRLAGTVGLPILGREAKLQTLQELARDGSLQPAETLAVGDGANDLAMIQAAGLGVAFRAKPILKERATASIVHGDLTALLYLQGYRREDFAPTL